MKGYFLNLPMRSKLMSAFVVMSALILVVGVVGMLSMRSTNDALDGLITHELAGVSSAQNLRSLVLDTGRLYRQVLLDGGAGSSNENAETVRAHFDEIGSEVAALQKLELPGDGRRALDEIRETLPDWQRRVEATLQAAISGHPAEARTAAADNGKNAASLVKNLATLTDALRASALADGKAADEEGARSGAFMLAVILLGTALGLGMGLLIANIVSTPLHAAVRVLGSVAAGDFTQRLELDTKDEVGQMATALNSAVAGMRQSLNEVRQSSNAVSVASSELSASSSNISAGAQEQASSLEETAAALEEITSTVQQNAEHSQKAAEIARNAREVAEKGGAIVSEAVTAMKEINSSSKQIAEIITTIDEIAFQTNLLALNAAVEAARAGEQGRGFAVVAAEVRNLAQRSATAAKEIKRLIQDSVTKVESGTELVNRSGEVLEEIVTGVARVTGIVSEIAAATKEQSTGITEVGNAVTEMDHVTQSNAAQTEELAATAESLASQAMQLQALVGRYQLGDASISAVVAKPHVKRPSDTKAVARPAPVESAAVADPGDSGGFEEF